MAVDVLGAPVTRTEDPRFITGKGRYLDDIKKSPEYRALERSVTAFTAAWTILRYSRWEAPPGDVVRSRQVQRSCHQKL